jgi:hypothetical protein
MKFRNKFWRIAKNLQTEQLQRSQIEDFSISESDLFNLDIGKRGGNLFLGFYSHEGIKLALEKYGVYRLLRQNGFTDLNTDVDTSDPYKHRITIYRGAKIQKNLIVELVLRKHFINLNMPFNCPVNGRHYMNLAIDWLRIQNIDDRFTKSRPPLPGQLYPGLGLSWIVLELLMIVCWRLNLSGLINVPDHYHNACIYSKVFYYINPDVQAQLQVLKSTFREMPLNKLSWGVEWGCVYNVNLNQTFKWLVNQQIVPIDNALKKVFNGKEYREFVKERMRSYNFVFDESKYLECKKKYIEKNTENCI